MYTSRKNPLVLENPDEYGGGHRAAHDNVLGDNDCILKKECGWHHLRALRW